MTWRRIATRLRRFGRDEDGQAMAEAIILVAVVGLGIAWVSWVFPEAISTNFVETQQILASPL